jgi:hypothetical protein
LTTDEYLKTCSNVPALPKGWRWHLKDEEKVSEATGHKVLHVKAYIVDSDDNILATGFGMFPRGLLRDARDTSYLNDQFANIFSQAYHRLYLSSKVNLFAALDIDPTI